MHILTGSIKTVHPGLTVQLFFCVWLIFQTRKTIPNQHGVESLFIVLSAEICCQYITRLQWKVYSVL